MTLPAQAQSVPAARRFVRGALQQLDVLAAQEAAELLVSEVVTNAVLHARTELTIEVLRRDDRVRVGVRDLSPAVPRQRSYGPDSTTGRGLRLVAALAAVWGVDRASVGKTVWFEVAGDPGAVEDGWDADADLDRLLAGFPDLDGPPGRARQAAAGQQVPVS